MGADHDRRVPFGSDHRMTSLLDAVMAVAADLELSEVLSRIVASACDLVDARYGALGMLGDGGERLTDLVTHGLTEQERAAIGEQPHGRGVVGLLIDDPRPLRVADLTTHPRSCGTPANHPRMHTFLGVPVRRHDTVVANLYLTEKRSGRPFTDEDEQVLVVLAASAGIAIEHARLYTRERRRRGCTQIVAELTRRLLEAADESEALTTMVEQACKHAHATAGSVVLSDDAGRLTVVASHPWGEVKGPLAADAWSAMATDGVRCWSRGQSTPRIEQAPAHIWSALSAPGCDHAVTAPLRVGSDRLGVLVLGWTTDLVTRDPGVLDLVRDLAAQSGVALAASRARLDRSHLALLADRERIARDMHDHVIQRLFATGLSLQSASRLATHPTVQERLEEAVDELDEAIKDIRRSIFELHGARRPQSLSQRLRTVTSTAADALGFRPTLALWGDLDGVEDTLAADVLGVVREGLANVARHAHARAAEVAVRRTDDRLDVTVTDDGSGMVAGEHPRSGLSNLHDRARARGGGLTLDHRTDGGTRLTWWAPS